MVDVKKVLERFEKEYAEEKTKECEELYNAIVDTIKNKGKGATIQNILYVLDIVHFELLSEKYKQIFNTNKEQTEGASK